MLPTRPPLVGARSCSRRRQQQPRRWLAQADATPAPTPLVEALLLRGSDGSAPFHIPGHKRGQGASPALLRVVGRTALSHDLTELEGLDYLASPTGSIAAALRLAAEVWSPAARSFFLVNGTTCGLHAALMATCRPGDAVVLARNCHGAVVAGCALAGVVPFFCEATTDLQLGVAHVVTPDAARAALQEASSACAAAAAARAGGPGGRPPRVAALLVVSPSYFGACCDVAGLAAVAHEWGAALVVDEAHGAHLGLHPALPPSALQQGADCCVQSTHKTLQGMTQASMLHVGRSGRVCASRVATALALLQTSSPSYLLLASLDAARAAAVADAGAAFGVASRLRARLARELPALPLLSSPPPFSPFLDPTRLVVPTSGLAPSGYEAAAWLARVGGATPEVAAPGAVAFVLTAGNAPRSGSDDETRLVGALRALLERRRGGDEEHSSSSLAGGGRAAAPPPLPPPPAPLAVAMSPRAALFAGVEWVPPGEAAGRVSARSLCPYPPGVPVAFPGARLTAQALNYLRAVTDAGGVVTTGGGDSGGAAGGCIAVVARADEPPEGAGLLDPRWAVL